MSTLRDKLTDFSTHISMELISRGYLLEPSTSLSVRINGLRDSGALEYVHLLGEDQSPENRVLKGVMLENPNGDLKKVIESCFAHFGLNAKPEACDELTRSTMRMQVYYEIMDSIANVLDIPS